jgi:hypothetical protein
MGFRSGVFLIVTFRTGKLVRIQHGPATVTGDESRYGRPLSVEDGKAAASRVTRKSGYHKTLG